MRAADGVLQARVREVQVAAPAEPHVPRRRFGFRHALLGRAARAHVAGRQIQHAGAVAPLRHADQRAAAGLLDIVGMRRDGQNVRPAAMLMRAPPASSEIRPSSPGI